MKTVVTHLKTRIHPPVSGAKGGTRTGRSWTARAAGFVLFLVAPGALAGCWQGQNAATYQQATLGATGDGVEIDTADKSVGIRGAVVVSNGSTFSVVATLVNHSDHIDYLQGVGIEGAEVSQPARPIAVQPGGTTTIGQANASEFVFGSGLASQGSRFVNTRFVFRNGGIITTRLLVRAHEGMWAQIPLP